MLITDNANPAKLNNKYKLNASKKIEIHWTFK